jgi:hypothetical protein
MKCVQICVVLYNFRIDKFRKDYVLLLQLGYPSEHQAITVYSAVT